MHKNKYQIFIKFESQLGGYFCLSYGPLITQYASVPLWTAVRHIFLYGPATFFQSNSDLYKISADYFPCLALTRRDLVTYWIMSVKWQYYIFIYMLGYLIDNGGKLSYPLMPQPHAITDNWQNW